MLISVCLLTGQFFDRITAALSLSLSFSTSSQSNIMWSIVCSPLLQEHVGRANTFPSHFHFIQPQKKSRLVLLSFTLIPAVSITNNFCFKETLCPRETFDSLI